ncbi:hypothetical protein BDF14DRAFT_1782366 [Spinellus fusiger]|nr:hypothetical protein BDF14DRAFT_1782366 [Spinellus fusiger]
MVQLSPYGERIIDRINMIGMWLALIICVRNFSISLRQYKRTRGKIHLVNLLQISVLFVHRFIFGLVPLFEITTCAFFPLLISLWHLDYILFYVVMFLRLIIFETERNSRWIKGIGICLITLRLIDWPYELSFYTIQRNLMEQQLTEGVTCLTEWGNGVIILNFIADSIAILFLSGMFVRRLYNHIQSSKSIISQQKTMIEYIAWKSLVCLVLAFFTNFLMNLLKLTRFLGNRSDSFTPYFQIIESTLLVEALRTDSLRSDSQTMCYNCGMAVQFPPSEPSRSTDKDSPRRKEFRITDESGLSTQDDQSHITESCQKAGGFSCTRLEEKDCEKASPLRFALFTKVKRETLPQPSTITTTSNTTTNNGIISIPMNPTNSFNSSGTPKRLTDNREWNNNDFRMF